MASAAGRAPFAARRGFAWRGHLGGVHLVGSALVGGASAAPSAASSASPNATHAAPRRQPYEAIGARPAAGHAAADGNAIDNATNNPQQLAAKTSEAAHDAGLGSWGIFLALMLPLGAAIGGGAVGAGRERRVFGLRD